jgi:uncharacterized protein (TIGR02145 family)
MRKFLLSMMLCCPAMLAAQNGVTVSGLSVDAGTVTFNVSWNRDAMPVALWSDTVWVFVDYNKNGVMERLPITSATASAGTVTKIPNNDKGVWVAGNARSAGSFSTTVQLFTAVSNVGGACAYASNYPPVGEYKNNATEISFTGTPMYEILLAKPDGETAIVKSGNPFFLPCDYTAQSFTDATGAPGLFNCIAPFAHTLSGSDIYMGADVVLTLSSSQSGWHYQLYKDNMPVGGKKEGTGNALVFSETSTGVGEFNYTVQTVDATGAQCEIQVSNMLVISVNVVATTTPQYAASTKTWTVGSQIWSDVINIPACDHDAYTNSNDVPYCRSYTTSGIKWYYYNWPYVNANKNTLCPSPWRVPSREDFIALDRAFGGDGVDRTNIDQTWITDNYVTAWGSDYRSSGLVTSGGMHDITFTRFWSATEISDTVANDPLFGPNGWVSPTRQDYKLYGMPVRCVR